MPTLPKACSESEHAAPRPDPDSGRRGSWRGEGASGEPGDDVMDIDMEADEEAAPPESKVKLEAPEMPVTRQRAVGGGAAPKNA